jgi:hypothetical protein
MALRMGIVCAVGLIVLPVTMHGASSYSVSHAPASVAALRMAPESLTISPVQNLGRMLADGSTDGSWLDDASRNFFALHGDRSAIHAQSYATYGAIGGYAEQADTPLVEIGIGPFTGTMWLGTLYPSDQIAARMAAETATAMQSAGYIPAACGTSNSGCQAFDLTWTDSRNEKHDALYGIEWQGQAVGEFAIDADADDMQQHRSVIVALFSRLEGGAHAVLNGATGTTSSGVTGLPQLNGAHPLVADGSFEEHRATAGHADLTDTSEVVYLTGTEFFAVVAPLENPRAYPRSAMLKISKGGQTLLTRPMVETLACCPEGRLFTLSVTFKQKALLGRLGVPAP